MVKINVNSVIIETERQIESILEQDIKSLSPWISVDDQLPNECQEVIYLAFISDGKAREIMIGHRKNNHWYHCCMFYSSQQLNANVIVTHWMLLPAYPYQLNCEYKDDL